MKRHFSSWHFRLGGGGDEGVLHFYLGRDLPLEFEKRIQTWATIFSVKTKKQKKQLLTLKYQLKPYLQCIPTKDMLPILIPLNVKEKENHCYSGRFLWPYPATHPHIPICKNCTIKKKPPPLCLVHKDKEYLKQRERLIVKYF